MKTNYKKLKKKILYFDNLAFQKESLNLLKKNFTLEKFENLKKKDFDKIISILIPMDNFYSSQFFSRFKNLRSIVTPTTGDIHLDKKFLKRSNIKVINLKEDRLKLKKVTSTSELTLGLILNLTRNITRIHEKFKKNRIFRKYDHLLSNKMFTLGVMGMGRIGQHVADRAAALGFNVIYFDPNIKYKQYQKIRNFNKFIKKTNILTLHFHYQKKYKEKFNIKIFKNLKKPSYFINTSRGELVKENDLILSLKKKIILGAGLDVLKNEHTKKFRNNPKSNSLFNFYLKNKKENLFITPKQGGSNKSAWELTERIIINKLIKYEKNKI